MSFKEWAIVILVFTAIGYSAGRYIQPAKSETKIVTQQVETVRKNIQVVIKEIVRPDGTKETVTTTSDKSTTNSVSNSMSSTSITSQESQWIVSAQLVPRTQYMYGIEIQRRILGPVFVGGFVNINQDIGITVSMEF